MTRPNAYFHRELLKPLFKPPLMVQFDSGTPSAPVISIVSIVLTWATDEIETSNSTASFDSSMKGKRFLEGF